MTLLTRLCLFSLIFLFAMNLQAQTDFRSGYIITNENDTVYGLIDYRGDSRNAKRCDFKKSETSQVITYTPADIRGYRYHESKYYVSKEVLFEGAKTWLFLEFLVNGIADLYLLKDVNIIHYYLEKSDGQIFELTNEEVQFERDGRTYIRETKQYVGSLKYAFSDAPQLHPMINNSSLDTKSLMNLTKKYHDVVCDDEKCIIYEKKLPAIKLTFAPYASMNGSFLKWSNSAYLENVKFQLSSFPGIGIQINTTLPRANEKISLLVSGEVAKSYLYGVNDDYDHFSEVHLHTTSLKFKAGLKYTYPKGKIRPTVTAGGNVISHFQTKERRIQDNRDSESLIFINEHDADFLARSLKGYNLDLGMNFHYSSSYIPFFSIGYSGSSGTNKSDIALNFTPSNDNRGIINYLNIISINAGLYF